MQPENFIRFVLAISFLLVGLKISTQIGGYGSSWGGSAVKRLASKGVSGAKGIGKTLGTWGGRKVDTWQMAAQEKIASTAGVKNYQAKSLNYRNIYDDWKGQRQKTMGEYQARTGGSWRDTFDQIAYQSGSIPLRALNMATGGTIKTKKQKAALEALQGEDGKGGLYKRREDLQSTIEVKDAKINKYKEKLKDQSIQKEEREEIEGKIQELEGTERKLEELNARIQRFETVSKRWAGPPPKATEAKLEEKRRIGNYFSEITKEDLTEEGLVDAFTMEQNLDKKKAYFQHLVGINGVNELFHNMGTDMTHDNIQNFLEKQFGEAAADVAADMSKRAESAGNYKLIGHSSYDIVTGKDQLVGKANVGGHEKQIGAAEGKMREKYDQNFARTTHVDTIVDRTSEGNRFNDLGATALIQIANSPGKMKQIESGNFQERFAREILTLEQVDPSNEANSKQITKKIKELRNAERYSDAESLERALEAFQNNYDPAKKAAKEAADKAKKEAKKNEENTEKKKSEPQNKFPGYDAWKKNNQ